MDRQIIEKFLDDECTPEEAREVLAWFGTEEGEQFLQQRLEEDSRLLQDERLRHLMHGVDSRAMWNQIEREVTRPSPNRWTSRKKSVSFWHVAAAMLIVAATSVFYFLNQDIFTLQETEHQPIHYTTTADQHKKLTLGDGTEIRLNRNSEIWLSEDFGVRKRELRLQGEAFFKVMHDEDRPFIIKTGKATITDLGTAFNVKADPQKENVQVAVTDGKVSVWSDNLGETEARELVKGQYAYLDLHNDTVEVDEFGVQNYLSWMNGRFKFEKAPLKKVCEQLERIYGISFNYSKQSIQDRQLTTNFERDSLTKALDVIALTLDISYQKKGDKITWHTQNSTNTEDTE